MGVAWPPAGSACFQSSLPDSEWKARKKESMDAEVNTRPPAVTMGPPRLIEPVSWPGMSVPRGASQSFLPEWRSTASVVPHGGARSEEHTSELQSHSDLVC